MATGPVGVAEAEVLVLVVDTIEEMLEDEAEDVGELVVQHFLQADKRFGIVQGVVFELVDDQVPPFRPWLLAFERRVRCVADVVS